MRLGQCLQYLTDRRASGSTADRIAVLQANGCPQRVIDSVMKNTDLEGYCAHGASQDVIDSVTKKAVVGQQASEAEDEATEQQAAAYDPAFPRVTSWPYDAKPGSRPQPVKVTTEEQAARDALGKVLKRLPTKWGESMEDRYERARALLTDESTVADATATAEDAPIKVRLSREAAAAAATAKANADALKNVPYNPELAEVMRTLPIRWGESLEDRRTRAEAKLVENEEKLAKRKAKLAKLR